MIPHRFARFLGAILLLAPSLAFGQATLQQPCTDRTTGCTLDTLPVAASKLYGNDLFLQGLIASRFNTLGAAALLNVGTVTGTVADGGFLTAEIARAKAAEQTNATAIQTNATAISAETSRAQGFELLKAPIASPALTGVPTAPTAANGTNSNQIATTAFVLNNAGGGGGGGGTGGVPPTRLLNVGGLVQGGGDLSTDRIFTVPAAAQSDVATGTDQTKALTSYSVAAALGAKAPLASPAFVGFPTAPTAPAGTSSTVLATTAFVGNSYAPLASPALTDSPTAPTQAASDNSTKLATTAYADRAAKAAPYIVAESLGTIGYRKWSDGIIEQWGQVAANGSDPVVTLPVPFATAFDHGFAGTLAIPQGNVLYGINVAPNGNSLTQIVVSARYISSGGSAITVFPAGNTLTWRVWGR